MKLQIRTMLQGINENKLHNEIKTTIEKRFYVNGVLQSDKLEQCLYATMVEIAQNNGVKVEFTEDYDGNGRDLFLFYNINGGIR